MSEAKMFKSGTRFLEPAVYETPIPSSVVFSPSSVYATDMGVVKDYSRYTNTPWAVLARFMVQHESSMLNHLHGIAPPAVVLDPYRLIMPRVNGRPLSSNEHASTVQWLDEKVQAMHSKKAVHNDLHASNIMIAQSGEPVILDLMSGMYSPIFYPLLPLRNRDRANVAKIKQRVCPDALTVDDRARLKKPLWVRSLQKLWYQLYRPGRLRALRGKNNP